MEVGTVTPQVPPPNSPNGAHLKASLRWLVFLGQVGEECWRAQDVLRAKWGPGLLGMLLAISF